jgi:hypothetical protein
LRDGQCSSAVSETAKGLLISPAPRTTGCEFRGTLSTLTLHTELRGPRRSFPDSLPTFEYSPSGGKSPLCFAKQPFALVLLCVLISGPSQVRSGQVRSGQVRSGYRLSSREPPMTQCRRERDGRAPGSYSSFSVQSAVPAVASSLVPLADIPQGRAGFGEAACCEGLRLQAHAPRGA